MFLKNFQNFIKKRAVLQQKFTVQVTTLADCDDITRFDGIFLYSWHKFYLCIPALLGCSLWRDKSFLGEYYILDKKAFIFINWTFLLRNCQILPVCQSFTSNSFRIQILRKVSTLTGSASGSTSAPILKFIFLPVQGLVTTCWRRSGRLRTWWTCSRMRFATCTYSCSPSGRPTTGWPTPYAAWSASSRRKLQLASS